MFVYIRRDIFTYFSQRNVEEADDDMAGVSTEREFLLASKARVDPRMFGCGGDNDNDVGVMSLFCRLFLQEEYTKVITFFSLPSALLAM